MRQTFSVVLFGFLTMVSYGHAASNRVGVWRIDPARSNFGSDPAPNSMTLTILKDSDADFGYRVNVVNADQSHFDYEWQRKKDGTPFPVRNLERPNVGLPAAISEVNGDLVEHGIEPNGMLESSRLSISSDGQTLVIDVHWITFKGTEITRKSSFHRAK